MIIPCSSDYFFICLPGLRPLAEVEPARSRSFHLHQNLVIWNKNSRGKRKREDPSHILNSICRETNKFLFMERLLSHVHFINNQMFESSVENSVVIFCMQNNTWLKSQLIFSLLFQGVFDDFKIILILSKETIWIRL